MASTPLAAEGAFASGLHITLSEPLNADAFTYLASAENAAIAIAALYESVHSDTLTNVLADATLSPMYLAAKASYRRDLQIIEKQQPVDAARLEEFVLDVLLCRMLLAGRMHSKLPQEVRP